VIITDFEAPHYAIFSPLASFVLSVFNKVKVFNVSSIFRGSGRVYVM